MNRTVLIFDVPFLAWRSHHSIGHLTHDGHPVGALYGTFRDIRHLTELFAATRCVFCFDLGNSLRKQIYPAYKAKRFLDSTNPAEILTRHNVHLQINQLRMVYLEELGYRNILYQDGFEADDLIAAVCQSLPEEEEAVIVSADHDLYQLLQPNVTIFNPNIKNGPKTISRKGFIERYGIKPEQWVKVKALAGCSSDNIKGIEGVGEITAIHYLRGMLKKGSKKLDLCLNSERTVALNWPLVELPFKGTQEPKLVDDQVSEQNWRRVLKRLDMNSLLAR